MRNRRFYRSFVSDRSHVVSVVVSADQRVLVSGGLDGVIRVWDLQQQPPQKTIVAYISGQVRGNQTRSLDKTSDTEKRWIFLGQWE